VAQRLSGLGKGLGALIPADPSAGIAGDIARLEDLPVGSILPNQHQPRVHFDEESLAELSASIREIGVLQPVLVRPLDDGTYQLVAGERRWRAARRAGLPLIPAIIRVADDLATVERALVENLHRQDLTPLEEAAAFQQLSDDFGLTHEQVAQAVGRSRSAVTNLLRLMQLAKPVQDLLFDGAIDMGHARALLTLAADQQILLGNRIAQQRLSVREAEQLAQGASQPGKAGAARKPKGSGANADPDVRRLETDLADALGATVKIRPKKKGAGQVVIEYGSLDQLDGIIAKLR